MLVHGDRDTDVPYEQSVLMDRELERHGVEHELVAVSGGGHGLANTEPAVIEQTYDRAVDFLRLRFDERR
jgi:dipeptidyl aminopeptidase/acylaminoacyl peptidase